MKWKINNNYLVIKNIIKNSNLFILIKHKLVNKSVFILKIISLIVLPMTSAESLSALSATTAKTIRGNAPYLVLPDNSELTNINQLFGVSFPKAAGSEEKIELSASESNTIIHISEGIKFSEVITAVLADGNPYSITGATVVDDDGDADILSDASIVGNITATWYNGTIAGNYAVTDLNQVMPVCEGPYYLRVRTPTVVQISTKYGTPRSKLYSSQTTTYTFSMSKHGICYVQPNLAVYSGSTRATTANSKWPYQNESNPGGYNPNKWVYQNGMHLGFKTDTGFPTTGFNKASFNLVGAGNDQSKYLCELDGSNSENWVTLSGTASKTIGQNCTITYNKVDRPTTSVKINMKYYDGTDWIKIDSYTIPKPTLWAVKGTNTWIEYNTALDFSGIYNAAISCGATSGLSGKENQATAASYFFKRNELTNSPIANLTPPTTIRDGYYSRDVDGTFTSEWGDVYKYPSSGWDQGVNSRYWTSEATNDKGQYLVLFSGLVFSDFRPDTQSGVMCKK